jgi:hypothetical protein
MTKKKAKAILGRIENAVEGVDDAIRELYARDGTVTPDSVIEAARDEGSPLHSRFNWDIEEAAMEHWRDTARGIIRSVRVVVKTERIHFKPKMPAAPEFIRDPSAKSGTQGYSRVSEIRSDEDRARDAIAAEIERADGCIKRAISIGYELGLDVVLKDVERALDRARAVVKKEEKIAS